MDGENIYRSPPIFFGTGSSEQNEYMKKQEEVTRKLLWATESKNVSEFLVKLVYGEDFHMPTRLLDTKIEAMYERVPELIDAIRLVKSYNNFRGEALSDVLRVLHERGYIMEIEFGREGSAVVYVQPPYWNYQASNYDRETLGTSSARKYGDVELEAMKKRIADALRELEPDELHETRFNTIRAWWD